MKTISKQMVLLGLLASATVAQADVGTLKLCQNVMALTWGDFCGKVANVLQFGLFDKMPPFPVTILCEKCKDRETCYVNKVVEELPTDPFKKLLQPGDRLLNLLFFIKGTPEMVNDFKTGEKRFKNFLAAHKPSKEEQEANIAEILKSREQKN